MGNPNITIESDSQVAIKSIIGQMQAPKQISKAIENVRNLVNNVWNIRYSYYHSTTNKLADTVQEKAHNLYPTNSLYLC